MKPGPVDLTSLTEERCEGFNSTQRVYYRRKFQAAGLPVPAFLQLQRKGRGSKRAQGFPKKRPCLGPCGRLRKTYNPGDRVCAVCKRTKWPGVDASEIQLDIRDVEMNSPTPTPVDTTVIIMDGAGQVVERVPAVEFTKRGGEVRHGPHGRPGTSNDVLLALTEAQTQAQTVTWIPTKRGVWRYKFRRAGLEVPAFLATSGRHAARKLEDLTASAVATFTRAQREHYRDKFRRAGVPVPASLAPHKSGPRPQAA
jgi:hypothetical protein